MKKKVVISICLLFSAITASFGQSIVHQTYYAGGEISGLIVNGAFDVQLSQGDNTGVTVDIREDLLNKLSVSISENRYVTLSFSDDVSKYFVGKNRKPLVKIVVSRLDFLSIGGNVSLIAKGEFSCLDTFGLQMAGGAFASFVKVNATKANIDIKGGAKIEDSKFNIAYDAKVSVSETAIADIEVNCAELTCRSATSSKTTLSGSGSNAAKAHSSGTSKLNLLGFVCPDITVVAMDMSRTDINVTDRADVTKSSMAAIRYIGNGRITGDGAKRL